MAHHLGLSVIAEGVEDQAQLSFLKAEKCEYAQGYLFSAPMKQDSAEKWLLDQPCMERAGVFGIEPFPGPA